MGTSTAGAIRHGVQAEAALIMTDGGGAGVLPSGMEGSIPGETQDDVKEKEVWEIREVARCSLSNLASGADDALIKIIQMANQVHPGALREIFTNILR